MKQAGFRFYFDLNEFLQPDQRDKDIFYEFQGRQSVKHLIESMHIPHTEVGRILVNGCEVGFDYLVNSGDTVLVFPLTSEMISQQNLDPRFLLDNHLGKLATYLRMLGFDSLYRNDFHDDELASIASNGMRILLTRDRGLLMRRTIQHGYCIRSKYPQEQIVEVVHQFNLARKIKPFYRCLNCNEILKTVSKQDVLERLQPLTILYYHEFGLCPNCNKIYWKGSHYKRMENFIQELIANG